MLSFFVIFRFARLVEALFLPHVCGGVHAVSVAYTKGWIPPSPHLNIDRHLLALILCRWISRHSVSSALSILAARWQETRVER